MYSMSTIVSYCSSLQSSFAETMLPLLIKMILVSQHHDYNISLQKAVLAFFEKHYEMAQKVCSTLPIVIIAQAGD